MTDRSSPWRVLVAVTSASACLLAVGCSDNSSDEPDSVSIEPLSEVASPDTTVPPSGTVFDSPTGLNFTTFDPDSRTVAALEDDSTTLRVFDVGRADQETSATLPSREIPLPGEASDVIGTGDGTVLLPMNGSLARVDLQTSDISSTSVDANLLSAAVLPDGRIAAGDDSGVIHIFDSAEVETIAGLTSVDALASTEYGLTALDRHQTSLTQIDVDEGSRGLALRAGTGAARTTTDEYGRILVTDAAGSELLVYTSDDLLLRQRFPVGAQPWAVAYDDTSDIVWVSVPATNEVVGFTLDTGIPVEVGRFPTVRQPDSITIDDESGSLFVGSATGEGLQRIPVGDLSR